MALLTLFAFLAGIGTALSPCVLPVLPIALSAGATGGSRRPLGVVTGVALSFNLPPGGPRYVIAPPGPPPAPFRHLALARLCGSRVARGSPPLRAPGAGRVAG